jgi:membrane protein YdbS with pleckstrin-like domain
MKKKKEISKSRNWPLVVISSILILIGLVLIAFALMYVADFGWWSLLVGATGLTTVIAACLSIAKNDPAWILLGLIIPG